MGVVVSLNDLTLDDLRKLSDLLTSIAVAGFRLEQDGLTPRFDLTPGMPIRITLGAVMPVATRPEFGDWLKSQRPIDDSGMMDAIIPLTPEAARPEPAPVPEEAPTVDAPGPPVGAAISAEPSDDADVSRHLPHVATASEAKAESGGGAVMAAAMPSAAPVPGSASALAAVSGQKMWTAEEDQQLIGFVVSGVQKEGLSKAAAIREAAIEIGRTTAATQFRYDTKLKERLKAKLDEAATTQAQSETPEIPEAAKVDPGQGDAAVGGQTPAAVQPDDLAAHLRGMTDKGGWSLQRDTDLMELSIAGWPAGDIALELRMQASAIKPRFDALTGLHDDEATGKKVRRWTREQVLEALQSIAKARAA